MNHRPVIVIPADDPPLISRSTYLEQLQEIGDVRLYTSRPASDQEMLDRLRPADILLNSRSAVKVSARILDQLPRLKMIAVCGVGYDSIDLEAADRHGIVVSNIPGRTTAVVAEHALGLMLAVSRRLADMTSQLKSGHWPARLGLSLSGKRLGVLGTGRIGCEMIRLCRAIGMEVVAWSFHPDANKASTAGFEYISRGELLQTSDVVSLHLRLSEQTRYLIAADELQQMKQTAILINTARAAIVDTDALCAALHSQQLFGAGIDVYDVEPIDGTHPLLSCPNVVLTPHSADQTPEGLDLLTFGCVENIRSYLNGSPQNVVGRSSTLRH